MVWFFKLKLNQSNLYMVHLDEMTKRWYLMTWDESMLRISNSSLQLFSAKHLYKPTDQNLLSR